MADQADVEQALVVAVFAALYPQGSDLPSVNGTVCHIHRGWPTPGVLEDTLAAAHVTVAILPVEGSLRPSTRFPEAWIQGTVNHPTLLVTVTDDAVAFSGVAGEGQIAGILVDGRSYASRTEMGDTPQFLASRLGRMIRRDRPAQTMGPVLGLPGATRLLARVVADQPATRELRRQVQSFRIACFCPTAVTRDATAAAIDLALARLRFLDQPDGSAARLLFSGSSSLDDAASAHLYRRDLIYSTEYATTEQATQAAMLFGSFSTGTTNDIH